MISLQIGKRENPVVADIPVAQAQEDEKRRKQRKPVLENGRIEQNLRLGNEKQEIPDNGIWDVGYDTDSLAFLPPSQRFVKGSYN